MHGKRKLIWFLIIAMLTCLFSGIQVALPQNAAALELAAPAGEGAPPAEATTPPAIDTTTPPAINTTTPPAIDTTTPPAIEATTPQAIQAPLTAGPLASATPAALTWQSAIFGNSVNTTDNSVTLNADGSITVSSLNGKGKVSSNVDGIAYYYTQLTPGTPFQITADVRVDNFTSGDNQVSFGLMVRNNTDTSGYSSFAAVGAVYQRMQAFSRLGETAAAQLSRTDLIPTIPAAGSRYTLKIIGTSDNKCIVSCTGSDNRTFTSIIDTTGMFTRESLNIGLFAARKTSVTFSNVSFISNVSSLEMMTPPAKTGYFLGESLDLTGLSVNASCTDGSTAAVSPNAFTVTGFDNTKTGSQTVTLYYAGKSVSYNITMTKLTCTDMDIVYTPAKTTYYIGDQIDTLGMVVLGTFNTGAVRALTPSEYVLSGFDSSTPGAKTVKVSYVEDTAVFVTFDVTIRESLLQGIEITRQPAKKIYYPGDALNLTGLVVTAIYNDSAAMLQTNEYTLTPSTLDTTTEGDKTLVITHKGKTANLILTVKNRRLTGIKVTTLPKTTFYPGDAFSSAGIVVSKAFDNGDRVALAPSEYVINSSDFNSNTPGIYNIAVTTVDTSIAPITYPVTVRPQTTYTWNTAIFGQSVSVTKNFVTPSAIGTVDGTITLTAVDGGGKVTGAHDGISYYYTTIDAAQDNFILSADIKVLAFAKDTPDNQEAFGLMVRDAIGSYTSGTQPVFSSNVAAVGGYRGLTNAFMRTGVTNSAGNEGTVMTATGWNTPRPATSNTYPAATYRLRLAKTNTGFEASLNGAAGTSALFYSPEDFNTQDPNLYVGFYAARLATIEVSNVSFYVSAAATDAERIVQPQAPVTPAMTVTSLPYASKTDYTLRFTSNVNGTATIKQGETVIAVDVPVTANQTFARSTAIAAGSNTNFTVTMTPDASQNLTSYNRLVSNFTVTMKTYETPDGAIYVSPAGTDTGTGTSVNPLDLDTAIRFVKEGQTIYMLGGTYNRSTPVTVAMQNDGAANGIKTLAAFNSEPVIIDFGSSSQGFQLGGNYWHIKGLNITRAVSTGFLAGGSNNTVERCCTYANGDTGMQISRFLPSLSREFWPVKNLILNCESYDNRDASENNADGFAAKLTCGTGNVFRGCIAHNNIDDGWDLYTKAETGAIGEVLIEDCIAYNNGTLTNGRVGAGDKNGFKLGGEGIAVANVIRNSLAFGNGASGFTSNSNPAARAYNCISFDNAGGNFVFTTFNTITPQFEMSNIVSYRSTPGANDSYPASARSADNYFSDGTVSINSNGVRLVDANFVGLSPVSAYQRDAQGNIIRGDFLKFIPPSDAALKGITVNKGKLTPNFSADNKKYVVYVDNNVKDVAIAPTASSPLISSIKVNNTVLTSGAAYTLRLEKGNNFVTIVVTAQDGTTKEKYLVNVFKEHDNRKFDMVKRMKEIWDDTETFWKSISN